MAKELIQRVGILEEKVKTLLPLVEEVYILKQKVQSLEMDRELRYKLEDELKSERERRLEVENRYEQLLRQLDK